MRERVNKVLKSFVKLLLKGRNDSYETIDYWERIEGIKDQKSAIRNRWRY